MRVDAVISSWSPSLLGSECSGCSQGLPLSKGDCTTKHMHILTCHPGFIFPALGLRAMTTPIPTMHRTTLSPYPLLTSAPCAFVGPYRSARRGREMCVVREIHKQLTRSDAVRAQPGVTSSMCVSAAFLCCMSFSIQ